MVVDSAGGVLPGLESGGDLSAGILGSIGFEQLAKGGEQRWQVERPITFTQKTVETSSAGRPGPQPLGPRGPGSLNSFGKHGHPEPGRNTNTTVTTVPGKELIQYEILSTSPGLTRIKKTSNVATLPTAPGQIPWLTAHGEGVIEFDTTAGVIRAANFAVKINNASNASETATVRLATSGSKATPWLASDPGDAPPGHRTERHAATHSLARTGRIGRSGSTARANSVGPACGNSKRRGAQRIAAAGTDNLFKKQDWPPVNSNARRIELALKLLKHASQQRPGSADHYVLLDKARDLAAAGGNAELAFRVIDTLTACYTTAGLRLKAEALATLAETVTTVEARRQLAWMALGLFDQAVASDQLDVARQLGRAAYTAAKKADDKALIAQTTERAKTFKTIQKNFEEFQQALTDLKKDPGNAASSTVAGKYFCLTKDDWGRGLPLLAHGGDTALAKLATEELAAPVDSHAQFELAEGWNDLAEQLHGIGRIRAQLHARVWYQRALPTLTGLARIKAEKFLASSPAGGNAPSSAPVARPAARAN